MNLDIFNITHNQIAPSAGKILISVPFINDTFFSRSVILLTMHDKEGSVGYILNKQLPLKLHELVDDIPKGDFQLGIGGPVAHDRLQMLHSLGDIIPNSFKIFPGLYWGGDFDVVQEMIKQKKINQNQIRFFMGYSGWNATQLQEEITADSWLVTEMSADVILSHSQESLWKYGLIGMGEKYRAWADFPLNPSLN